MLGHGRADAGARGHGRADAPPPPARHQRRAGQELRAGREARTPRLPLPLLPHQQWRGRLVSHSPGLPDVISLRLRSRVKMEPLDDVSDSFAPKPLLLPPHTEEDGTKMAAAPKLQTDLLRVIADIWQRSYIYEVAKRYPHIYAPELLGLATLYNTIVFECCAMEDKAKCFITRMTEHKKLTIRLEAEGQHTCLILRNFGRRTLTAVSLVRVSQKYPKATFDKVQNLTEEITHLFEDCCNGDMMECMVERMELVKHTCENHEELSSKLKYCCEKPLLERSNCIVHLEYDDIPSDLSLKVTEFLEDPKVCKKYDEHENEFLARFLYEYSRTHPEYSTEQLLTIVKVYEGLLDKCCPTETPLECCKDAEAMLANKLKESKTLLETNCAIYQKVGDYLFQNELLVRYTKKMPRVTHKSLIEITHHMTDVGSKCCALPENQKMPCADGGMSKIIGEMCERQKKIHINDKVAHCCNDSYSGRRSCFTGLDVDETYVPPAITDETFHFNADLCTATPEELPTKKQELLITLLKLKPHLVQDQLTEMTTAFTNMSQKCCSADDQQLCFNTEKPILIEHCQRVISA
ncbi:hypothetical protein FKM82_021869 [Ascaphus truei]